MATVDLWQGESQFFFESLLQNGTIPVFAEDQRDHQPVVPRAHLAIAAVIAKKRSLTPRADIGWCPIERFRGGVKVGRRVTDIAGGKQIALADRLRSGAH